MKTYSVQARNFLLIVSMCAIVLSFCGFSPAQVSAADEEAPVVPGEYIVVFKDLPGENSQDKKSLSQSNVATTKELSVKRDAIEKKFKNKAKKKFSKALRGFSGKLTTAELKELRANAAVDYVVPDRIIKMSASKSSDKSTQTIPTGIDRINANGLSNRGAGVNVAVIDTGISSTHPDLVGKVVGGINCDDQTKSSYEDDHGHGTHVAGTIAALDNDLGVVGVAPEAKLWSVKVLDKNGSGTWAGVICGMDYVTANAPANGGPITVANLSLGGKGKSDNNCGLNDEDPFHTAVCRARDAGVTIVVAAGNSGASAAKFVPAAYDDAVITVSALADYDGLQGGRKDVTDDSFANFSNFNDGKKNVIDIAAPGVMINSALIKNKYGSWSGTSMASPHVAGAAALYIATHKGATWTEVRDALVKSAEPAGPTTHKAASSNGNVHLEPVLLLAPNQALPAIDYSPVIEKFEAPKITISPGQQVSLSIAVRNASTTTIEENGVVTPVNPPNAKSMVVKPNKTTTYKLTVTNPHGSVTATTQVLVAAEGVDIVPPSVTLVAPAATVKKVSAASGVTVSATARDNVGVAKVDFFADSDLICSVTQAPYSCTWTVPANANPGYKYMIMARATDTSGLQSGGMGREVTVRGSKLPSDPAEEITITEPSMSPTTIGEKTKVRIESRVTFNVSRPDATHVAYYVKDTTGKSILKGKMLFTGTGKGKKYDIAIAPVLRPKVSGESLVFVVEVQDKDNKVLFQKTSATKLLVSF